MIIRIAKESDRNEILNIHRRAFGKEKGPVISKLVDDLLDDETARPILSLVAVNDDKLIGHILYTKVRITQPESPVSAQILAPLAILPDVQKRGIGQKLVTFQVIHVADSLRQENRGLKRPTPYLKSIQRHGWSKH